MAKTIGLFKYHTFEVIFTCEEEAGWAKVQYKQCGGLIDETTHTYENLGSNFIGSARSHFENCVGHAMNYTSRSMVEQFVQQGS